MSQRQMNRLRVLVVDDDAILAKAVRKALSRTYDAFIACSVKEALNTLETQRFDAVLVDFALLDGHGTEVLEVCRTSAPTTRRILLTALVPRMPKAIPGEEPVAHVVLVKPCELAEILRAVEGKEE